MSTSDDEGIRLQKVLARAGVASRRAAEQLIIDGRVEVNGTVQDVLGARVDPMRDVIRVDGERLPPPDPTKVYLVMNKPTGVVSTMSDPQGRSTLTDYLTERKERLFHVGRLDTDTEGLILLVNDGEFAHRMAHPSYEVPKTYVAEVEGQVRPEAGRRLRAGVQLDDGLASADKFRVVQTLPERTMVELVLHQGRNRIVRRMLDAVGHPVRRLVRTAIGPVRLGNLRPGELRDLDAKELGALLDAVEL